MKNIGRYFWRILLQQGVLVDYEFIQSHPKIHDGQNHDGIIFGVGPVKVFRPRKILPDA
jgi:hypothetical protein